MTTVREPTDDEAIAAERISRKAFDELRRVYRPKAVSSIAAPPMIRLVAENAGQIVGTVAYVVQSDRLHIRGLAVDAAFRRIGIARTIIAYLTNLAAGHRLRALSLYTIKQAGSVPVFERLGFRSICEEPATWAESDSRAELTEVFMEKPV